MTIGQPAAAPACQVCGERQLREVEGFAALPRITSDCRAYPAGGSLHVCLACGGVQKIPDSKWLREIGGIYAGYEAYYQSGGDEQIVFDRATGKPRRRSDVILERLVGRGGLASRGRALDVGCGNGATLAAMSATLAGWSFSGYELGEGALPRLSRIPRFEKLHTGSLDAIGQCFDLVTLIHALEHFPEPVAALSQLRGLVGDGQLFIEVCNIDENPFDILVADHLMHFSPHALELLLERAGFGTVAVATDWVPKEISLLARAGRIDPRSAVPGAAGKAAPGEPALARMASYVAWLRAMVARAGQLEREDGPLGIFGTSIAATWLGSQLGERVSFFVDEDESRVGKKHLGRPIVRPQEVPAGANVYVALSPAIAGMIAARHAGLPCRLVAPPPLRLD
jgi:SAM-dependent methyltransferase